MKENEIEEIVGHLGKTHGELVANQIFPEAVLREIYPGSDLLYMVPEEGLELDFSADEKVFIGFYITLKKSTPSTNLYKGELPEIFPLGMDQKMVIDLFGDPYESRGPILLPQPIGQIGGWASYIYDEEQFPGIDLQFQYTADMQVEILLFCLRK